MKRREMKSLFKEVGKMAKGGMSQKEKRVNDNNTGKVKLPYKMMMGMQKKSLERHENTKKQDNEGRVIGDSGRRKKLMQNYFEKKDAEQREEKRLRLDTTDRGTNWHQLSLGQFKNGALHFSKNALERLDKGDIYGGAFKKFEGGKTKTNDSS